MMTDRVEELLEILIEELRGLRIDMVEIGSTLNSVVHAVNMEGLGVTHAVEIVGISVDHIGVMLDGLPSIIGGDLRYNMQDLHGVLVSIDANTAG